jgi:lysylphosphatidylglycerol synthetase-like protein (DUF2156 family)
MFFSLLLVTFLIAAAVSAAVIYLFDKPIARILDRIVSDELSSAWHRYIKFAAFVVGVSGGVPLYQLDRYVNAPRPDLPPLELNAETWTFEVYRTIIGTLQSIAWMLLVVFVVALIAFVIVRAFELRRPKTPEQAGDSPAN